MAKQNEFKRGQEVWWYSDGRRHQGSFVRYLANLEIPSIDAEIESEGRFFYVNKNKVKPTTEAFDEIP